jgi:signal transduction histidine kinase
MLRSVFARLFVVAVLLGLAVNVVVYRSIRSLSPPPRAAWELMDRNVRRYFVSLAESIGDEREEARARAVTAETGLEVRVDGPFGVLMTQPDLPRVRDADVISSGRRDFRPHPFGGFEVLPPIHHGASTFVFYMPVGVRIGPDPWPIAGLLLIVSALLALAYYAIRRMLAPLRALTEGVATAGRGDLRYRVATAGRDEFSRLGSAFNDMLARIEGMVQAKEQLLIDVSHELQSPLARMKMALQLMKDERSRQHLARDVGQMEQMVAEVLESARLASSPGALDRQPTDVAGLVAGTLQPYLASTPGVELAAPPALAALVDGARLAIVLRNLVDNALKYTEAAGPKVSVTLAANAEGFELSVRDFGPGIPDDEIPRLFEPFYRIDQSRSKQTGGYGLGLSLCQRIVSAHGGTIGVSNAAPHGLKITVWLPL